jgi:hypothetical protein
MSNDVDFRILKENKDVYTLMLGQKAYDDNGAQLTDVSIKIFVIRRDLEHLKGVIERKLAE